MNQTPLFTFTRYQKFVVAMLAFLQFTVILDFMILSPLGALLMPELKISPAQFGTVVSAYAFSAGIAGLLAAGFADRFDRKRMLMFFYVGFILGTFLCSMASSYEFLLFARIVTGLFGGVVGSIVFAITTDLFPMEMRGRVMGIVQTAFAASQIMGIPFGLFLSNNWGWHAPFLMIVFGGAIVGFVILYYLKPINEHLHMQPDRNPFHHLIDTLTRPRYLQAFATTALLATGGFMLMPFGSAFSVHNLGIDLHHLPLVYMITGLCSMLAGPLIGRAADSLGKFKVFCFGSIVTIVTVLIYTRLGITPIGVLILISSVMFIGISSRIIASSALISGIPEPKNRGSFMSVSSSVQQISGGFAAILAGLIVVESDEGKLLHFDTLGNVVIGATLITLVMMYFIHRKISMKPSGS